MDKLLLSWKTNLAGLVLIALGVVGVLGIHVPGFSMDPGAAFAAGLGLLMAKDADVTTAPGTPVAK